MAALQQRGHEVTAFPQQRGEPRIALEDLARHDIVHVHRQIVNDDDRFVERLHDLGVPVCFDNDDDAGAVTDEMWGALGDVNRDDIKHVVRTYERSLALVPSMDLVTTPSEAIAERLRAAGGKDVRVIDNYLPSEFMRIRPVESDGFTIGWHGGREHVWDSSALGMAGVLQDVLAAHPHVHVVTIGLDLGIDSNRYTFREWARFPELTNHLAGFDIGIAPLDDSPFNQARSAVKLREYAAAGVPWLASAVGPYRGLGKDEGGRLVEDGDWFGALDKMIRASVDRVLLRRRAKAWARREAIDRTVHVWEDAFLDLLERPSVAA